MIRYLNRTDCCSSIENLELISTQTHIMGAVLMQCQRCGHADYYPVEQIELAQLEGEVVEKEKAEVIE